MPEPGRDFMERLNPTSRAHFREARANRMLSPVSGESQVLQKWSLDVAKRAIGGALGREVRKPEELEAALTEIKSDGLRRFVRASTLLADAELEGEHGKQVLLQRSAKLREIQEEEDLGGTDGKVAEAMAQAIGRKLRAHSSESGEGMRVLREISEKLDPKEKAKYVSVENPNDKESQVKGIITALGELEELASRERKTFEDDEFLARAVEIRRAISIIPDAVNNTVGHDVVLSRLVIPPKEVRLKERLLLIFEARRKLHNRKIEVLGADGNLSKMVPPPPDAPLSPKIMTVFTDISPVDWYVLVHHDDLLKEAAPTLGREVVAPVADALDLWLRVGESWGVSVDGLPAFNKTALNEVRYMTNLRSKIAEKVGIQAEQAAFDIHTITLSFDRWDKLREKGAGSNDPRELMHFEEKRRDDWLKKNRPSGPEDTIGAYFAKEYQGELGSKDNPDYSGESGKPEEENKTKKRKILRDNAKRSVFKYSLKDLPKGQLIGDLWESVSVSENEDDEESRRISLLEIAKDSSFKNVPFERLGEGFYQGYFGYGLGYVAQAIQKEVTNQAFKLEEVAHLSFWIQKGALFGRLPGNSPFFTELSSEEKEKRLNIFKRNYAMGIFWSFSEYATTIGRKSFLASFLGSQDRGSISYRQGELILSSIKESRFLSKREYDRLFEDLKKYHYLISEPSRR